MKFGIDLARVGQYAFGIIGTLALAYWTTVSIDARLFQRKEASHLARQLRAQVAPEERNAWPGSDAERHGPSEGAVVAGLKIPRLGLSTVVVEGVEDADLKLAPGHIPGTALPGEPGNVGIAGHRDTFFRPLRLVRKDDVIALTTPQGEDRYRVVSTQIAGPDDVQVLYPTTDNVLTLITCYPFDFVGSAPKRFIVRAEKFQEQDDTATKE